MEGTDKFWGDLNLFATAHGGKLDVDDGPFSKKFKFDSTEVGRKHAVGFKQTVEKLGGSVEVEGDTDSLLVRVRIK